MERHRKKGTRPCVEYFIGKRAAFLKFLIKKIGFLCHYLGQTSIFAAAFVESLFLALKLSKGFHSTSHFSSAVEQLIRNQQVEGSNPLSGSK